MNRGDSPLSSGAVQGGADRWLSIFLVGEVVVYALAMTAYLVWALPGESLGMGDIVFLVIVSVAPVALNLLHGDRPADSGFRLDNLPRSARQVGIAAAAMATPLVVGGLLAGTFHWRGWDHFGDRAVLYLAWGPIQQYVLQAFWVRRLRQAGLGVWTTVVLAAGLFSLVHVPNPVLMALTFVAGLVWCRLFLITPNLITLGLAHGVLATLAYYALPLEVTARMTVGGIFLEETAGRVWPW